MRGPAAVLRVCGMRRVDPRVRVLCSSSVMKISGGGSESLSCSSSLESRTKGGGGSVTSSMYGMGVGLSGSVMCWLLGAAGGTMSRKLLV